MPDPSDPDPSSSNADPDLQIAISVSPDWPSTAQNRVETALRAAYRDAADLESDRRWEVSVALTDDAALQALNKAWRGKDRPTNVLSFPAEMPDLPPGALQATPLGDIALAAETVQREAREQDKSFDDHLTHLTVHGLLHLLGYDHETTDDAAEMEALEIEILARLGVADPYRDAQTEPA